MTVQALRSFARGYVRDLPDKEEVGVAAAVSGLFTTGVGLFLTRCQWGVSLASGAVSMVADLLDVAVQPLFWRMVGTPRTRTEHWFMGLGKRIVVLAALSVALPYTGAAWLSQPNLVACFGAHAICDATVSSRLNDQMPLPYFIWHLAVL